MYIFRGRPVSTIALALALTGAALVADDGADHRVSSELYGVSGGNVNDISRRFCCSGTLGALVSDGASLYILSNNHVLARSDAAQAGEDVSQPGFIDNNCEVAEIVADLSYAAPLGSSNVDAALAELRVGRMAADGEIMDVGIPGSPVDPTVGLAVQKSGRTTGHTTASITAINLSVQVQYQEGCGTGGKRFRVIYTNQIGINSSTFSAGGDSGSLILTNNRNPVGLLFAGSSTTTIANPIGEVLAELGSAAGKTFSFDLSGSSAGGDVGGGGGGGGGRGRGNGRALGLQSGLSPAEIARGTRVKDAHEGRLMADPAVLGVGVGEDEVNPGRAAVVVLVRRGQTAAGLERELDGVAVRVIETDDIVAYGWNEALGGSCKKVR